ncbi:MAG TPA: hypothetical protein V6D17_20385 [Candidatus Obscuribacterales bacterium]
MTEQDKNIMIGDLLVRAGLISSADLTEAMQVTRRLQMPIGRVLIMSGNVTQEAFQIALEAQSLVRDGVVTLDVALEALPMAARENLGMKEALQKIDRAPQFSPTTNRLGELLVDSGIITPAQLEVALKVSLDTGLPLGGTLVTQGALHASLLPTVLRAQEQIRDGKVTREKAVEELRAAMKIWAKAEESLKATTYAHEQKSGSYASTVAAAGATLGTGAAKTESLEKPVAPPPPEAQPAMAPQAPPFASSNAQPIYGYNTPYGHAPYGNPNDDPWASLQGQRSGPYSQQVPPNAPLPPYGQPYQGGYGAPPSYQQDAKWPAQQGPYGQPYQQPYDPNYPAGQYPHNAMPGQQGYQQLQSGQFQQLQSGQYQQQVPGLQPGQFPQQAPALPPGQYQQPQFQSGQYQQQYASGQYQQQPAQLQQFQQQAPPHPAMQSGQFAQTPQAPATPELRDAASQLAARLGWGNNSQKPQETPAPLEQEGGELPAPRKLQWTNRPSPQAEAPPVQAETAPAQAGAMQPQAETAPAQAGAMQPQAESPAGAPGEPRKLKWTALARTTMTGQPSIHDVLSRQPAVTQQGEPHDKEVEASASFAEAPPPPNASKGEAEPPSGSEDPNQGQAYEPPHAQETVAPQEPRESTASFLEDVIAQEEASQSSPIVISGSQPIVSFSKETTPSSYGISTYGHGRGKEDFSQEETGTFQPLSPSEMLTGPATNKAAEAEPAKKGKGKAGQSHGKMPKIEEQQAEPAPAKGKKASASQSKMQAQGGKASKKSQTKIPAEKQQQQEAEGQMKDSAASGATPSMVPSPVPGIVKAVSEIADQDSFISDIAADLAGGNPAKPEMQAQPSGNQAGPIRAASLSLTKLTPVTDGWSEIVDPATPDTLTRFPVAEPTVTIVELFTLGGFFTKKDVVAALDRALEDASIAPDLLLALGLADEEALDVVLRCQTLVRTQQITMEQAVYILGSLRTGRVTFEEALAEIGIGQARTGAA